MLRPRHGGLPASRPGQHLGEHVHRLDRSRVDKVRVGQPLSPVHGIRRLLHRKTFQRGLRVEFQGNGGVGYRSRGEMQAKNDNGVVLMSDVMGWMWALTGIGFFIVVVVVIVSQMRK